MTLSVLQTTNPSWNNGGTWTPGPAFVSNVTSGNLLVCTLMGNPNNQATLTDTRGNTWVRAVQSLPDSGFNNTYVAIYYVLTASSGACTLNNIDATQGNVEVVLHEVSGFGAGLNIDGTAVGLGATYPTAISVGPISTTEPTSFLVCGCTTLVGPSAGTPGWTAIVLTNFGNVEEYLITSGAGSYTATFTPGDSWSGAMAAFSPPAPPSAGGVGQIISCAGW